MPTNLRRKAYDRLLRWKESSRGASAILINGARRVGKSYLAREFAQREYGDHVIVDFSSQDDEVADLIRGFNGPLSDLFSTIDVVLGRDLPERDTLVVFDEVQLCPKARQMIKHLVADGRYDYIETGTLISIRSNIQDIVIPSEEEDLELFPLDFEEFLWAMGNENTIPYLRKCLEEKTPVGEEMHRKMMGLFRKYMLVGGMPQSVTAFVETGRFEESDAVKRRILTTYRKDVGRYAGTYAQKVNSILEGIPAELSRKEKRFRITSLGKNARNRDYEDAFMWLADGMIVNPCVNAADPTVGLWMNMDAATQKLYMADTGLLVTQCLDDDDFAGEALYKSILLGKIGVNEGMFAENVVAQCLRAGGHRLYFYSRPARKADDGDGSGPGVGIDFLIRKGGKVCPVEVKSSDRFRHESLNIFMRRFGKRIGQPYLLCTKDVHEKDGILFLPLYMASVL